jgi:hypothetical protein
MAIEHAHLPWAAVQFHPESILTSTDDIGLRIITALVTLSPVRSPPSAARSPRRSPPSAPLAPPVPSPRPPSGPLAPSALRSPRPGPPSGPLAPVRRGEG